jgi:hypothetical protein
MQPMTAQLIQAKAVVLASVITRAQVMQEVQA